VGGRLRLDGVGRYRSGGLGRERGQAALLVLGVLAAALAGTLVLFGFGQALGARGKHQRAADLAAVSAAQVLRRHYSRLFEPAFFASGLPNPRHLSNAAYLALARAAARLGARRNGVAPGRLEVSFPGAGFAPTRIRVAVKVRGETRVRVGSARRAVGRVPIRARATAELVPAGDLGLPEHADGGGYHGPLAYRAGQAVVSFFGSAVSRSLSGKRSSSDSLRAESRERRSAPEDEDLASAA
jgi:hypothetical protein